MKPRKLIITSLVLAIGSSAQFAQEPHIVESWGKELIAAAHTGTDADYLSEDEKMVILYTNLARLDGALFAETFLAEYIRLKDLDPSGFVQSLYEDLYKVKNLPVLIPERDLYRGARDHATWSGKKGYEGHKRFKSRFDPLMKKYTEVGENIYYGQYTPIEIVIQLLIDEGIPDLGHRINLLNPRFNSIGVSIKPHKEYEYNCVMAFGRLPRSYQDYIERP